MFEGGRPVYRPLLKSKYNPGLPQESTWSRFAAFVRRLARRLGWQ